MSKKTDFNLSLSFWIKHLGSTRSLFSHLPQGIKFAGKHFIPDEKCIQINVTLKRSYPRGLFLSRGVAKR